MKLSGIFCLGVIIMILTMDGRNLHITEIRTGYVMSEGAGILDAAVSSGGFYNEAMTARIYSYKNEREMVGDLLDGKVDVIFLRDESILFDEEIMDIRVILVCRLENRVRTIVCVKTDTLEKKIAVLFGFAKAIGGKNTADYPVSLLSPEEWPGEFADKADGMDRIAEYLAPDFHREVLRLGTEE